MTINYLRGLKKILETGPSPEKIAGRSAGLESASPFFPLKKGFLIFFSISPTPSINGGSLDLFYSPAGNFWAVVGEDLLCGLSTAGKPDLYKVDFWV